MSSSNLIMALMKGIEIIVTEKNRFDKRGESFLKTIC